MHISIVSLTSMVLIFILQKTWLITLAMKNQIRRNPEVWSTRVAILWAKTEFYNLEDAYIVCEVCKFYLLMVLHILR